MTASASSPAPASVLPSGLAGWLTGQNTGGTKGPSTPAGQSTTEAAPVLAPPVSNPYGLGDFPVTDGVLKPDGTMDFSASDFDSTLSIRGVVNGKLFTAQISPYLCAKTMPALALLIRLNELPGVKASILLADPDPQSPGSLFHTDGVAYAYQMIWTGDNTTVLETTLSGNLLVEYLHLPAYAADNMMVADYGPAGSLAKSKGLA